MTSFRVLRKTLLERDFWEGKSLWPCLFAWAVAALMAACVLGGCASAEKDYDPEYHQNLFYLTTNPAPSHEKKAHLDFFNKECSASGTGSFSCHYTDQ